MSTLPHDIPDLHLAPVVLAIDARIQEMGQLGTHALTTRIAIESDMADWTRSEREVALLRSVEHLIDRHGWSLGWDPRGIRVSHAHRTLVLGTPASFAEYLTGDHQPAKPDAGASIS